MVSSPQRARNSVASASNRLQHQTQDVVGVSVGQPIEYVRVPQVVWHPGLPIPKIEPPSVALANPQRVSSRKVPNFSTTGF